MLQSRAEVVATMLTRRGGYFADTAAVTTSQNGVSNSR